MRSLIPTAAARSRSVMMAVVLGTAMSAGESLAADRFTGSDTSAMADLSPDAVRDITRYCHACWRNARLPADRWDDCTQQVFARLLENIPVQRWTEVLAADESPDRREFVRAIDAVKKRTQRGRKWADLANDVRDDRTRDDVNRRERREAVDRAATEVLSDRQRKIVELSAEGWAVPEIADELKTTPERVSDEKYKAIRKLRTHLGVDG